MAKEAEASHTTWPVTMWSTMPMIAKVTPSTAVPSSATTVRRAGSRMPSPSLPRTWKSALSSEAPSASRATPSTAIPAI